MRRFTARAASWGLVVILAWTLFAFGGVRAWALWPALLGVACLVLLRPPALLARGVRGLDLALSIALTCGAVQLVPLPGRLRGLMSPSASDFDARTSLVASGGWHPLALVPEAWLWGIGLMATTLGVFWMTRDVARGSEARFLARSIAWIGAAVAVLALVERALFSNGKIYGVWKPARGLTHTAGPFVSRNHFASWLIVALAITSGYLVAHWRTHWLGRIRLAQVLNDTRAWWLMSAAALMTAALFVSQSRGGLIGFGAAVGWGAIRTWTRAGVVGRVGLIAYLSILLFAAFAWAHPELALSRFDALQSDAWGGRPEIWRETWALIGRFWFAGVGLGGFDVVMAVYQTATRSVLFNHAHNQYLHVLAEGGFLVGGPLLVALAAFLRLAWRRLDEDRSPLAHVREGAMAGLVGVGVQSIWETPLLTPAVCLLVAAAAALAIHETQGSREHGNGSRPAVRRARGHRR